MSACAFVVVVARVLPVDQGALDSAPQRRGSTSREGPRGRAKGASGVSAGPLCHRPVLRLAVDPDVDPLVEEGDEVADRFGVMLRVAVHPRKVVVERAVDAGVPVACRALVGAAVRVGLSSSMSSRNSQPERPLRASASRSAVEPAFAAGQMSPIMKPSGNGSSSWSTYLA